MMLKMIVRDRLAEKIVSPLQENCDRHRSIAASCTTSLPPCWPVRLFIAGELIRSVSCGNLILNDLFILTKLRYFILREWLAGKGQGVQSDAFRRSYVTCRQKHTHTKTVDDRVPADRTIMENCSADAGEAVSQMSWRIRIASAGSDERPKMSPLGLWLL